MLDIKKTGNLEKHHAKDTASETLGATEAICSNRNSQWATLYYSCVSRMLNVLLCIILVSGCYCPTYWVLCVPSLRLPLSIEVSNPYASYFP